MKEVLSNLFFFQFLGKKVDGNNQGAVHVIMKRKYRQYMNRKGGFNRPLDFVAWEVVVVVVVKSSELDQMFSPACSLAGPGGGVHVQCSCDIFQGNV